jgi:hypothetical protein
MMKKLMESFRRFQEERNVPSDITAYRMVGLLIIAKRMKRKKGDILSDIRAIEGITTVTVGKQRNSDSLDFSEIKIKIDTTPLTSMNLSGTIAKIQKDISQVKGVQSFKVVSRPESI